MATVLVVTFEILALQLLRQMRFYEEEEDWVSSREGPALPEEEARILNGAYMPSASVQLPSYRFCGWISGQGGSVRTFSSVHPQGHTTSPLEESAGKAKAPCMKILSVAASGVSDYEEEQC